jgi:hypothetical protein
MSSSPKVVVSGGFKAKISENVGREKVVNGGFGTKKYGKIWDGKHVIYGRKG